MLIRLILATVIGAVVMFAWGFVYWCVSPLGLMVMKKLPAEAEVVSLLKQHVTEEGVYFSPFCGETSPGQTPEQQEAAMKEMCERHAAGPLVMVSYSPTGADVMSPVYMIKGFVHCLASALLAATLLTMATPGLRSYFSRVGFVVLLGVFAVMTTYISQVVWFQAPLHFQLLHAGYTASQWLFTGAAMALIVRPTTA